MSEANCLSLWPQTDKVQNTELRAALGWQKGRSVRSQAVANDREVKKVASLINKLVDLPHWTEAQEQELFENATAACLEAVASTLPPPFLDLLCSKALGLEDHAAAEVGERLVEICRKECRFPYLDEQDKRRIIRAVVFLLVEAMKKGQDLKSLTDMLDENASANKIIVHVFMAGAMDVFFDEEMRRELVQDMTAYVKEVPFMPMTLVEKIVESILRVFSGFLADALESAFYEYKEAGAAGTSLPILPKALAGNEHEEATVLRQYEGKPFMIQLRRIFIEKMDEDFRTKRSWLAVLSERHQDLILGYLVDCMFGALPGVEKIEDSVQPFGRPLQPRSREEHRP